MFAKKNEITSKLANSFPEYLEKPDDLALFGKRKIEGEKRIGQILFCSVLHHDSNLVFYNFLGGFKRA